MSGYGHPTPGRDAYDAGYDEYEAYQDTYAAGAGRAAAAVGAAAGRASVAARPRPRYQWSGGRAGGGRASVPVSPGGPGGLATGRATVRPGGSRPAGSGGPRPPRKKKRHWLRNTFLSVLAAVVIIAGGGMVALSYYVESVPPPGDLALEEASTVYYSDGSEMASLQEVNREIIDTTVPELANARNAVVAAEDKGFYDHSGVDFLGIVRAGWNNITGGDQQGASTIDQQYARRAAELYEGTYRRKLQEAAMAYKMNQEHTKDEILGFYLNAIYFGRGAHGIQAAAQAYFDVDAAELSVSQAAVLAGVIRIPDDGTGLSPYDPLHPENPQVATDRWSYVLTQMVDIGALTPGERAELTELPEVIEHRGLDEPLKGPQGNVVRQVERELEEMGITDAYTGGYRITTTIDPDMQKAALEAARRENEGPLWEGMPENIAAAMVAIDPETGAVRAYYGGDDGFFDRAGPNQREDGTWYGGRPPGSSFKIYTLVAMLREGISFDSHWKTSEFTLASGNDVRNAGRVARNCEGRAPDYCTLRWSTIQSYNAPFAHFSERVPETAGPTKIVQAAMDAGVRMMTDTTEDGVSHDLTAIESAAEVAPEYFFHQVAFGQYAITPLDHASGVATLAASGMYHEPHFVATVQEKVEGEWVTTHEAPISGEQRILPEHANAITGVLSRVPGDGIIGGHALANNRPAAAKTGTWEYTIPGTERSDGNADAWVVGYTPQIATAVWVGDGTDELKPIRDQFGNNIGSGGLPAQIWKQFMDAAHEVKELPQQQFPPAPPVGNPQHPLANGEVGQQETRRPGHPQCILPWVTCPEPEPEPNPGDDDEGDGDTGIIFPPPIFPTPSPEPDD